jgi:hypothetical protein
MEAETMTQQWCPAFVSQNYDAAFVRQNDDSAMANECWAPFMSRSPPPHPPPFTILIRLKILNFLRGSNADAAMSKAVRQCLTQWRHVTVNAWHVTEEA